MLTQTRRSFEFGTQFSSEPEGWRAACRHVVLGVRATMQDASFALNPSAAGGLAKLRECERGPGRFPPQARCPSASWSRQALLSWRV